MRAEISWQTETMLLLASCHFNDFMYQLLLGMQITTQPEAKAETAVAAR